MLYKCRYFMLQELLPPNVFRHRGAKGWELLDSRLLITLDNLRDKFGVMIVNNWSSGGNREWSGLRTPDSPYYSPYSQHTFGRAADILFKNTSAKSVREYLLNNKDDTRFRYINAIENNVSWLHIDVRNCERIKLFNP